ncbi:MAG: type II and III secretion system protein [Chthoniobacterales bacterium]|nr:type II and III secretion system protein [Chthoniobacterales bacterium]
MTTLRLAISLSAVLIAAGPITSLAGTGAESYSGGLEAGAEREIIRRQENAVLSEEKLREGDAKLKAGNVEGAYLAYKEAVNLAADGDPTKGLHARALSRFCSTAVRYAEYLVSQGEYAKAEAVAREVLEPAYNPDYRPAALFLSRLEQPDYFNKTITPEFAEDRSKVEQLLIEANGFYDSGRYDMALKRYEQVLSADKYNAAAMRGMEQVELGKQRYYDSAYNDTRSRMLWEVDKAWERPRRKFVEARTTDSTALQEEKRGTEMMLAKLNRIIVPRIDFKDATVRQAIGFLQQRSRDLDTGEADAERRGVNIVLKLPTTPPVTTPAAGAEGEEAAAPPAPAGDGRINLSLSNVPLYEALRYVATLAGLKVKVEPFAVSIVPLSEPTDTLEQREFKVPPGFIPSNALTATAEEQAAAPGRSDVPVTGASRLSARQSARQFLESQGVEFPPGASANFIAGSSRLVVRNTAPNLDLIESLVDAAMAEQPTQVEIESKFVEVSQNNLKELGFDWALGPFSIPGSDAVFGSGGTTINDPTGTWPFVNPATGTPIGTDSVTSGIRSGTGLSPGSAVSANSIDALLSQSISGRNLTAPAPGIFSISGVFTNPQFQMVIRALNQKKGVDLMAAPKVTTKSQQKARIQITREFPYPETFTPPDVPNQVGNNNNNAIVGQAQADPIVTPAFPETMTTRELGVILEVTPQVGPDGYTIDLNLSPQVVDFDGFVNYGSPIYMVRNRVIGQVIDNTVPGLPVLRNLFAVDRSLMTENVINQPIFSVRKVTTNVSIWDGQTVALGGLIREDVQKVNDKVPILGDIPLAGVAFRSEVDQKIKKNLIIFVTARLMDAAGQLLRPEDDSDQEEIVDPLGLPKDLKKPSMSAKGFRQK